MAALINDLKARGRLNDTIVVWMGEFGPHAQDQSPRRSRPLPRCFNVALAGGGVKGGQVIGSSGADGSAPVESPVTVPDLFTSICKSCQSIRPMRTSARSVDR